MYHVKLDQVGSQRAAVLVLTLNHEADRLVATVEVTDRPSIYRVHECARIGDSRASYAAVGRQIALQHRAGDSLAVGVASSTDLKVILQVDRL